MNRRAAGTEWEKRAAGYLEANGMKLKERNFRCRQGEIDLIGYHEGYLVFAEVKYRSGTIDGYASEAVGLRKQIRICKVSDYYRALHGIGWDIPVRYDVIAVQGGEIEWIKNAFPYVGSGKF